MREHFQTIIRKFGLLNKTCCSVDGIDLSVIQSHILYEIDSNNHPSMQQVAELLGIDITTFSRQIQTLVKMELVEKVPSPEDKRVTILMLTELGKNVACDIDCQVNEFIKDIFNGMSDFERETVARSIQLLAEVMNRTTTIGCKTENGSKC
ncbi:MarR family winged helix-turn-helix transcriptional regulator [Bacillus sp. CGMCC 1.16607]|uniref:MarR family winged helix-turn-helix transcriptional regulator n=1 Tax=Bacillus sp. CGMCC 1.16607 TaxID=3351842 RepID=UPI00363E162F